MPKTTKAPAGNRGLIKGRSERSKMCPDTTTTPARNQGRHGGEVMTIDYNNLTVAELRNLAAIKAKAAGQPTTEIRQRWNKQKCLDYLKDTPQTPAAPGEAVTLIPDDAARFLKALGCNENTRYRTFDDAKQGGIIPKCYPANNLEQLPQANEKGAGVFLVVNETTGDSDKDVIGVRAVFVDLDGAPLEPVTECSFTPHIVVESSPGRYHAYWKVVECPLERFTPIQQAIAGRFNGDKSIVNLSRVMRLPGFIHQKAEPFQTRIISIDDREPYTVQQIIEGLRLAAFFQHEQHKAKQREQATGDRPGDDYNRRTQWGEVLPGWTLKHTTSDGREMWNKPGHTGQQTATANYAGSDLLYCFSDSASLPSNEGLSKFAVFAYLQHGGDFSAASKELSGLGYGEQAHQKAPQGATVPEATTETATPLPLLRVTEKNDPFPIEALPPVIQAAAARVREVVQAPLDLVCQSFLAAATLATQPLVDVLIDGRRFPVSNNFIALGVSGERKSAVDRIATGPIKERQHEQAQAYHADKQKIEAAKADWENKRKAAFKEDGRDVIEAMLKQAGEEPKHVQPCHMCSEPSFQGIERAFAEGRYTLGLFSDEGGRFLGGYAMKEEQKVNTITGMSKLWDGDPLDRLRVGDGKSPALSILYGRRFSVHLMLQPALSGQLFGNSMMSGQGFLSRCLCSWPDSTIGTRPYKPVDLAKDRAIQDYNATMKAILDAPLPMNEREEMGLSPRALTLTAPAKATWTAFHNHVEADQKPGGDLFPITGFASKTAEHAARIAGVLTAFQNPDATEINNEAIEAGISIAQYYLGEALRLFHTSNDDLHLTLAVECFTYGMEKTGGVIGLRDLYQYGPNAVRTKDKASQIMRVLEEHSRAVKIDGGAVVSGTRNRDAWQLIPLEV